MGDRSDDFTGEGARPASAPAVAKAPQDCAQVDAEILMQGQREILIIHHGERYRLRVTSKEKLILTK
ncbi:MAG: Hemin uptake protein hemP [Hyphomicrobiales bacterium]|jgi:hemin uptake protein HemP|nr:Hemin uptake protein hemP [Hyphomicrobiales bacterium]